MSHLYNVTLFGHTFGKPTEPQPPTPLEVATRRYVETQHALLSAHDEQERAQSTVDMLFARRARLLADLESLKQDPAIPQDRR